MDGLDRFSQLCREHVDATLRTWLDELDVSQRLNEAMCYSVFNGGKRMRPMLTMAAAKLTFDEKKGREERFSSLVLSAAAAVECIHCYSLIHDDLPAMDDDELRRGRPTCHIAFDEATAILAGDALQSLAFEKLASIPAHSSVTMSMVCELARASGPSGMVAGQMLDLQAEGQGRAFSLVDLETLHRHKTGALITASVRLGAIAAGADDPSLRMLTRYAEAIGLAFQVHDDVIDVTSDSTTLGKPQGADVARGKSTYVSLLGLDKAREYALRLVQESKAALHHFNREAEPLCLLADYIVARDH